MYTSVLQVQVCAQSYVPCCCTESAQNSSNFGIAMKILRQKQSKYAVCKKITSCHQNSDSSRRRPDNNNNNNCCSDPTSVFSIGAARNNAENRLHTNNTCSPSFSYLIIGATGGKDSGGYEFQFSNNKYNRFVTPLTPTRHRLSLLESQETMQNTYYLQITRILIRFLI